jgi:hypothetical protein
MPARTPPQDDNPGSGILSSICHPERKRRISHHSRLFKTVMRDPSSHSALLRTTPLPHVILSVSEGSRLSAAFSRPPCEILRREAGLCPPERLLRTTPLPHVVLSASEGSRLSAAFSRPSCEILRRRGGLCPPERLLRTTIQRMSLPINLFRTNPYSNRPNPD